MKSANATFRPLAAVEATIKRMDGGVGFEFTIEIQTCSGNRIKSQAFSRFPDSAWNTLWEELEVSERQWKDWNDAVQAAQQPFPLLPDFPQISKLAYIDEGVVHFDARELSDDCIRILTRLKTSATRELIGDLLKAARSAQRENADVVVHPFGR